MLRSLSIKSKIRSRTMKRIRTQSKYNDIKSSKPGSTTLANSDTDSSFTIISNHKRNFARKLYGSKTIPEGTKYAVWNSSGQSTIITGPNKIWGWGKSYEELPLVTAQPSQFIRIINLDGTKEHLPGPISVHLKPLAHKEISVLETMRINSHEAIVLYKEENGKVTRKIISGPASHVPSTNEWIHKFSWHGSDPTNRGNKLPAQLQFIKLKLNADQMQLIVPGVRTKDDTILTIQLIIFYSIKNIELMLDLSHDPIGDFVNACSSDIVNKINPLTFSEFKQNNQELNNLDAYSTLVSRAKRIGYNIEKVVFRGFKSTDLIHKPSEEIENKNIKLDYNCNNNYNNFNNQMETVTTAAIAMTTTRTR